MTTKQPNIIWIMCDQMRWDCAGFAGHPIVQTPNLDALAERGVCFENAYCASPVCSPARASWLTGLYPHAHTQMRNYGPIRGRKYGSHLPEHHTTIGDILKAAGYRCGMIGPWHLGDDHLPQHGFEDEWLAYRYVGEDNPDPLVEYFEREGIANLYNTPDAFIQYGNTLAFKVLTDPRQQRTTWTIDRSIDFVQQSDDRPFFLFASIKDPHPKMLVSQDVIDRYNVDNIPIPETLRDSLEGKPAYHGTGKFRIPETVTDAQIREMTAYYYALITHIDAEVGRLVNGLKASGSYEDTIIVFMSDHGELLGDHGYTEKCFMYEASVRVPCVVSWPNGLPPGQRVTSPLGGVDLMPTLIDLAGTATPTAIDGISVAESIRNGTEPERRPVFAEIASQEVIYRRSEDLDQHAAHVMMLDGQWKYVWNRFDIDELYELENDPLEIQNFAEIEENSDRVSLARKAIAGMVQKTGPGPYSWCCNGKS